MMLRVTDNGQGMTPERLYEVQEAIRTGERAGFGLAAVSERIALYYGPGYGLKISSTEGEGTVMEVYMAKKLTWITIQEQFYGLLIETYEGLPNNVMYELCRLMLNCAK